MTIRELQRRVTATRRLHRQAVSELRQAVRAQARQQTDLLAAVYAAPLPETQPERGREYRRRYNIAWRLTNPNYMKRYMKVYAEL